jgi:hypothetical protein
MKPAKMNNNMKPTHYFLDCTHSTADKNKLQKEFSAYLHTLNKKLIDASSLAKIKKDILKKLEELNTKYPRCTPISIWWYENTITGCIAIHGFFGVTFYIKPAYYESTKTSS